MKAQAAEKTQQLIDALTEARQETLALLDGADVSCMTHPDSGWTVQDIINHLAWCDEWSAKMLEEALAGIQFEVPKDWRMRDANDLIREQRKNFSVTRSCADLSAAHEALKTIIADVSPEKLTDEFKAPWGQMITTVTLVKITVEHEAEHREEIRLAVIS